MNKIIILGHENPDVDSIVSGYLLEKIMIKKGYDVEFIIPDEKLENDTINLCIKYGLNPIKFMKQIDLSYRNKKYILVDHNKRKLNGEIVCIIDHHPTNKNIDVKEYYNKKISSTACYICTNNEELLDEFDLKLAILATVVDTASFHSTKSREEDKKWVISLCDKYKFNYDEFYNDGIVLTSLDNLQEASLNGLKRYDINDKIIESSYIHVKSPLLEKTKIETMIDILKTRINNLEIDAFVFIIHDMTNFKTMYYLISKDKIETKYYNNYTPRGDTIIPEIEKNIN